MIRVCVSVCEWKSPPTNSVGSSYTFAISDLRLYEYQYYTIRIFSLVYASFNSGELSDIWQIDKIIIIILHTAGSTTVRVMYE